LSKNFIETSYALLTSIYSINCTNVKPDSRKYSKVLIEEKMVSNVDIQ